MYSLNELYAPNMIQYIETYLLDVPTIRRLVDEHDPVFIVPLGNDRLIRRIHPDARTMALDWGEAAQVRVDVTIGAEPMHHWTARTPFDRNTSLWAAFVLSTPSGRILFVGDSGYGDGVYFKPLHKRYGRFRLAIVEHLVDLTEHRLVLAFEDVRASYAMAHHFGTVQLTDEGIDAPAAGLAASLAERKIAPERFRALRPGDHWFVPPETGYWLS